MKDEIKEILDYLGNDKNYNCDNNDGSYYLELPYREAHELKDCITNLQEKYERMKENAKILSNGYNDLEKRNEKANTLLDELLERAYIDGEYILYDYSTSELLEVKQALEGDIV